MIIALATVAAGCDKRSDPATAQVTGAAAQKTEETARLAHEPVRTKDQNGPKDVVDVAVRSKDHTTLVTALKAAEYVDSLTNAGPCTEPRRGARLIAEPLAVGHRLE